MPSNLIFFGLFAVSAIAIAVYNYMVSSTKLKHDQGVLDPFHGRAESFEANSPLYDRVDADSFDDPHHPNSINDHIYSSGPNAPSYSPSTNVDGTPMIGSLDLKGNPFGVTD